MHTGVATVGNFGGRARFDYTAMGDTVNTAARLESANKRYGTRVGVSQETVEAANAMAGRSDRLPLLQTIGHIMLKGKTKPVTVYTINNDAEEEFVWAYEAAFSLIENEHRIRQATRGVRQVLGAGSGVNVDPEPAGDDDESEAKAVK